MASTASAPTTSSRACWHIPAAAAVNLESVNLNALVDESLNLAYHGARAQDQNFNITIERAYGEKISPIALVPQDMTRVFLNLFGNAFYATNKRKREMNGADFRPTLAVTTRELGDAVEVRVRDNGGGIPAEGQGQAVPAFFHDEANRRGHRARTVDQL